MDRINLGLIGLGYIGKVHLLNASTLESAKLVAASDISKKALGLAKRMGAEKTYKDYKQLLKDANVDAVIIALPTHLHALCAVEAAEASKHVLLEKPLAQNTTEGKKIVSACKKGGIRLMVGYPARFASHFQALKQRIESGELGEVQIAHATNVAPGPFSHRAESHIPRPVPEWWFNKELTGGGALMDMGSHAINLLRWYFGEVSNVKSYLGYRFNLDVEDHALCILSFKHGPISTVTAGWFSQQSLTKVEVLGTMAHATAARAAPNKIKTAIQLMTGRTPGFYVPHFKELAYFIQCLKQDIVPSPSPEDGLKDLEVIELAYRSKMLLDNGDEQNE